MIKLLFVVLLYVTFSATLEIGVLPNSNSGTYQDLLRSTVTPVLGELATRQCQNRRDVYTNRLGFVQAPDEDTHFVDNEGVFHYPKCVNFLRTLRFPAGLRFTPSNNLEAENIEDACIFCYYPTLRN
eukprot:TRINITY_DN1708_c0_g1_i1.p1 TRINITY_DN1708_c0_g1~~TRINITY_DN1708_c0_g1_i1.p1  ORF type:complete len:149 (-),score=20.01 TRINITY_DN1708_c0_g1_i1:83-463(-)